ncbi:autoinducer binding domain-containing protein [Algimonas porphyrae]|uniref:Transcription factor LuxR-like autoinducer-binding domain-containing protein n=1 Tax=Algimonas porphyrae TaxID=1128113 RepID=A0ABQ5UZJ3_9PROT|nr:autoinducer binding domain-containing protein [Algimonas porphyrae]GLQ20548.1 hypothetical protein GCM10007854_15030 [Algimonas porphyrae]
MWEQPTRHALAAFEHADHEDQAFDALNTFARAVGADLLSYHHIDPPLSRADEAGGMPTINLMSHGFPDEWVRHYESSDYHRIDPITAFAAYQTRPVLWSNIPHRVRLSPAQQAYMEDLYRWLSPGDGLAVPLFGPSGRHGYVGIGWRKPIPPWDPVKRRAIQSVCESFHLRICELRLAGMERDFELTDVQMRILRAMASGQPDAIICGMVNLRPEALRTAIARTLTTMGVSDRPSAVLRAHALGLIDA